jgi:general secretion pathway protein D
MVKHKYLSADINENAVKTLITPVDEEDEEAIPYKSRKKVVIIPDELKQSVSLSLNENLSVKSVLCETAKKLGINFQIDPAIEAKIIFQARKKSFIEILDAICDMANLRYTISGGMVKVVNDEQYSVTYNVQFLNCSRDSENKISIATEVASSEVEGKDNRTSDSNVIVKGKGDFWQEMEDGLSIIIETNSNEKNRYSVNRQSGVVTVYANSKVQSSVAEYIEKVKESTMSQVLIEAKIIEVSLKNEYRRGINWNLLNGRFKIDGALGDNASNGIGNTGNHGKIMSFGYAKNSMSALLNALEEFGSTRTISNPRIRAMNNQAAILKVAQNHVYFKLNYDKTYATSATERTDISVSSDIKTIPIGFVMFVQPSIDVETGVITLFLRPTITKLAGTVNDPAVDIAMRAATASGGTTKEYEQSKIPVTEVREVASVLKLDDGEIAVLGGFMEARSSKNETGTPGLKDVPVVREIVSSTGFGDCIVELVILIKVKLIRTQQDRVAADMRLQRLVLDPRPF